MQVPDQMLEAKEKAYLRVPGAQPKVDPVWLAVAAGDMHGEGKLFMPSPTDVPTRYNGTGGFKGNLSDGEITRIDTFDIPVGEDPVAYAKKIKHGNPTGGDVK